MFPNRRRVTQIVLLLSALFCNIFADVLPLNLQNFSSIYAGDYSMVLINFYADWCHYSNHLKPIFESASNEIPKILADESASSPTTDGQNLRVLFAKIDCDRESPLCRQNGVQKYPTIRVVKFGNLLKKEYRGARTVDGFRDFVKSSFQSVIKEIRNLTALETEDPNVRSNGFFLGYFESASSFDYEIFKKVSWMMNDDYGVEFLAAFGETSEKLHPPGQSVIMFRPGHKHILQEDVTFPSGEILSVDQLKKWAIDVSRHFIREVKYANAEEIMEEKKSLLILFRMKDKHRDVENMYVDLIRRELMIRKDKVNFLLAEGKDFQHALFHLGKSLSDLPVIALDSSSHMYMFPDTNKLNETGELLKFIDESLAKAHSHSHNIVIQIGNTVVRQIDAVRQQLDGIDANDLGNGNDVPSTTTPVQSVFQKLAPSKNRYTLLHDEL